MMRYSYDVIDRVGSGGESTVYKAIQRQTQRVVALKIRPRHCFRQEKSLVFRLRHANIARYVDEGRFDNGQHFIAYEFVAGFTLKDLLYRDGRIATQVVLQGMAQVLEALVYLHERNIVHCDLKPHNIMMALHGYQPRVTVIDFDSAQWVAGWRGCTQTTGHARLTPMYSAPESLRDGYFSSCSDLYAWGLVLLECLTGAVVIQGGNQAQVQQMACNPIKLPAGLSPALYELLRWVLQNKSVHRPQNTREFYHAFMHACAQWQHTDLVEPSPSFKFEQTMFLPTVDLSSA